MSGGTGSGKTTLLNALSRFIPSTERVVTIEDTAELELQQPHIAKLESQPADLDGEGEVTMRDLVRNSLRMRPDRIIVGECRGGEAFEMLQAMSTGHEGSMTTIHAGNPREAITRVELITGLAGMDIPVWAIRKLITSSISLVIQISRLSGGKRKITSISEITGMEGDTVSMHEIFSFVQTGHACISRRGGLFLGDGDPSQFPEQAEGEGSGLAERTVHRAAFSVNERTGNSPMTSEPQPPAPDPLRSAIQTRHPQIAEEIEGAIKTLRKLKEIATPDGQADSIPDQSEENPATIALTRALEPLPSGSGPGDTQALAKHRPS